MDIDNEVSYGDEVTVPWGLGNDVHGVVEEIYGPPGRRHAVVVLSPEISGDVVAETTTISLPLAEVQRVA